MLGVDIHNGDTYRLRAGIAQLTTDPQRDDDVERVMLVGTRLYIIGDDQRLQGYYNVIQGSKT